ncbi:ATP-binding protein [Corynebacterium sp. HMSC22B11]|uniref:ATP-binding protein n=1 Tax=Corynebacterium sp. HMSC22B11 TaxID=1581056 RepID=UPI0008A11079|nr:ATP-binding protein [Corynebacterium sp. HMSC22B11]
MTWDSARIQQEVSWFRLRQGDSTTVDVKRAAHGLPENLGATTCAFANMPEGGTIILGIDERSNFDIVGVPEPAKLEAGIVDQARNAISPCPYINTYSVRMGTAEDAPTVVVAEVQGLPIQERPARYKHRAYLRQADGDYEMHASDLRMIEAAKSPENPTADYDMRPVPNTSAKDLDEKLVQQVANDLRQAVRPFRDIDDDHEILRKITAVLPTGELSVAGYYALSTFPQGVYPALSVTCAVRLPDTSPSHSQSSARTRNLERFSGPLPTLLDQTMEWITANLSTYQAYLANGHMVDRPELPLNAIREAVANALIHRDLGPDTLEEGRSIDVRITHKALMIMSPGGLKSLSVSQLKSDELWRQEVNQRLYRLARSLRDAAGHRIIEGEGGGVQTILKSLREQGLKPPTFVDTGVKFTAFFWRDTEPQLRPDMGGETAAPETTAPAPTDSQASPAPTPTSPAPASKAQPSLQPSPAAQPLPDLEKLGKNAPAVYKAVHTAAVGGATVTLKSIIDATNLSESQVRYALKPLIEREFVHMHGGQGRRGTTYTAAR